MPKIVVDSSSLKRLIKNVEDLDEKLKPGKIRAVTAAAQVLHQAVLENIAILPAGGSEASHREALEQQDHPYARRHGTIQISLAGGSGFGDRRLYVHTITGKFAKSLRLRIDKQRISGNVFFSDTDRARFIIQGTRVMLPRDILGSTAEDPRMVQQLLRLLQGIMVAEVLRLKFQALGG